LDAKGGGAPQSSGIVTGGAQSPVIKDTKGDVNINFGTPPAEVAK
jgi:hypothetical protein